MSQDRWKKIYGEHANESPSYAEYFKENLIGHLTKENDPTGEKNQPGFILEQSKTSIGRLSRIFDTFSFPVPSFEQMKEISNKPNGLRNHMQGLLDEVLPTLLNNDGTALNPAVIEAIGHDNYKALKETVNGREDQIAKQFVDAIFVSYGQRILDNTQDEETKLQAYSSLLSPLEALAKESTLKGLPEPKETLGLSVVNKMINELDTLMKEAKNTGIEVTNAEKIRTAIDNANAWLKDDPDMPPVDEETKIAKAQQFYDKAVDFLIEGAQETLAKKQVEPAEANWFKKVLRFITGNEKLLQSDDEKRYSRQINVLSDITNLHKEFEKRQPTQDSHNGLQNTSEVSDTISLSR